MKQTFGIVLGCVLFFGGSVAFADVVDSPPDSCLPGAQPSTCHGGPHCRALSCMTDADCQAGLACEDRSYCVGKVNCAGALPPDANPADFDVPTIEGVCGASSCSAGSTCSTLKVCVTPGSGSTEGASTSSPSSEGGCSCRYTGPEMPLSGWLVALGAALGLMRRRHQKSP